MTLGGEDTFVIRQPNEDLVLFKTSDFAMLVTIFMQLLEPGEHIDPKDIN